MHRRDFMQKSLSLAGTVPVAAHALTGNSAGPLPQTLHVLVDTRLEASLRFGDAAATRGARISRYHGDLTQLWQQTLQPQWRSGRGQMAGISTGRGWLCLAQLAGEYRWDARARRVQGSELVAWSLTAGMRS
jgi:hypothetical protein